MTDTVVEKANGDKDRRSDEEKAKEEATKKEADQAAADEKNAVDEARNELLAPDPVDISAI